MTRKYMFFCYQLWKVNASEVGKRSNRLHLLSRAVGARMLSGTSQGRNQLDKNKILGEEK